MDDGWTMVRPGDQNNMGREEEHTPLQLTRETKEAGKALYL